MRAERRFLKTTIGATSVTLDPAVTSENKPGQIAMSQIVVSTGGATPDPGFWGTVTTDGARYKVTIERLS